MTGLAQISKLGLVLAVIVLTAASPPGPRLYVHIKSTAQVADAAAFRTAMAGATLDKQPIITTAPDVKPSGVKKTEIRCATKADCVLLSQMQDRVNAVLHDSATTNDMSAQYDGRTSVRPLHFEIWFADGPIRLRTAPPLASMVTTPVVQIAPSAALPPLPAAQQLRVTRPAGVSIGDHVQVTFTKRPVPFGTAFAVTVDGRLAAVTETAGGFDFIVPDLDRNIFTAREVPFSVVIANRWRITPNATISIASWINQNWLSVFAAAIALLGVLLSSIWLLQNRKIGRKDKDEPPKILPKIPRSRRDDTRRSAVLLPEPPLALVSACRRRRVILFLGTAINAADDYPSHADILEDILDADNEQPSADVDDLYALLENNETDTVTNALVSRMGRPKLVAAVLERYADLVPLSLRALLRAVRFAGILNSGFSPVEKLLDADILRLTPGAEYDFLGLQREDRPFLLQISGNTQSPDAAELTDFEIAAAIEETPNLRQTLGALFASQPILFLGVTPKTLTVALEMIGIRTASSQNHYALIEDGRGFETNAEQFKQQYGIEFLKISAPSDIAPFAERLAERVTAQEEASAPDSVDAPDFSLTPKLANVMLRNIGPFNELKIDFKENWSILLGNNGAGKSTVLRAVAFALCGNDESVRELARTLLRRGAKRGSIEVTLLTEPSPSIYRTVLTAGSAGRVAITASVAPLQAGTIQAFGFAAVRGVPPVGRIDAGTEDGYPRPRVADVLPLISGIDDRGKSLRQWINRAFARSQDPNQNDAARVDNRNMLKSLFRLIDSMVPGFTIEFSRVDTNNFDVLLKTSDGEVPLDFLSQGMSSTLGWAGPLIQRLYEINGTDSVPEAQHAILLIDEIDSHLHPEWQQKLVPSLKGHFPNLQVIATTHSPLMVGNLGENEVLRVIRSPDGLHVDYLEQSFIGYRFDQILTDDAFGLERARSSEWSVREEYVALLSKPEGEHTPSDIERLQQLREEQLKLPAPFETPDEWKAARESKRELDEVIANAQAQLARSAAEPGEKPNDS